MPVRHSPTAVRRWIAINLRRMREDAGFEPADAAARIDKGVAAYRHYENNTRTPSASDVEVLLNWYGKPERVPFFRELLKAAQKGEDWWINFPTNIPGWFEFYLGLESAAARISSYDSQWVPGLLQTREYAEALYRASEVPLTDDQIASTVDLRMARQAIITRADDPPQIWCVLDESALRRKVGGPEVMQSQLDRLVKLTELPNVEIQVLTFDRGAHAGAEGTFTLLDYPQDFAGDPGTVYVETHPQGYYYEQPQQITSYRRMFERLQVQAEDPEKSSALISKAAKDTT